MTDAELLEEAVENVERTYLAVGSAMPGAHVERSPGIVICTSTLGHPISNFGLVRSADARSAEALRAVARARPAFSIYVQPGREQAQAAQNLSRAGWRTGGSLAVLASGQPRGLSPAQLRVLSGFEDRLEAARQMGLIFFSKLSLTVRDRIALSTADSSCDLVASSLDEPASLAMIHRTGTAFGIYSLCVPPEGRRRGAGSALLEALLRSSLEEGRTAVLQCEASLEPWYRRWGFRAIGNIRIFT